MEKYQIVTCLAQDGHPVKVICKGGIRADLATVREWAEENNETDTESVRHGGFYLYAVIPADRISATYPTILATAEKRKFKASTQNTASRICRMGRINASKMTGISVQDSNLMDIDEFAQELHWVITAPNAYWDIYTDMVTGKVKHSEYISD